ncbi:hypothetical protein, partial [Pseudomonas aeruginosa]
PALHPANAPCRADVPSAGDTFARISRS